MLPVIFSSHINMPLKNTKSPQQIFVRVLNRWCIFVFFKVFFVIFQKDFVFFGGDFNMILFKKRESRELQNLKKKLLKTIDFIFCYNQGQFFIYFINFFFSLLFFLKRGERKDSKLNLFLKFLFTTENKTRKIFSREERTIN